MLRRTALAVIFVLCVAIRAQALESITVAWDPNPPAEGVVAYLVYVGATPGGYAEVYDVGNQTSFVYPKAVAGQEYVFAIVAYSDVGGSPASEVSGFSNAPPYLVNPGNQTNSLGQAVALQLNGSDIYGEPVSYGASGLPLGLTLGQSTGLISSAATSVGTYSVTVTATDGVLSTSQAFVWFIDGGPPALAITSPTTQGTYSAGGGTVALGGTASDDVGVDRVTWVNNRGGAGQAIGTTSWTIPVVLLLPGENVITVTAQDVAGFTSTAVVVVTFLGSPVPMVVITLPTMSPAHTTNSNLIQLAGMASDSVGVTSVTWVSDRGRSGTAVADTVSSFTAWSEPQAGLLPGANVITVTARNASGQSGSAVLTVTYNQAPTLPHPGSRTNAEGDLVWLELAGIDPDGDSLTYTFAGLPPGLTLDRSSGLISGTLPYTAAGEYSTTLAASDTLSTTYAFLTWTVTDTNRVPSVTNPGAQTSIQGTSVMLAVTAMDPDGDHLNFGAANLPPGLTINPSTGVVSGTPMTLGVFTVVIGASDGSATGQASLTWNIASPPLPGPAFPVSPSGSIATKTPAFSWAAEASAAYYLLSVSDASVGSPLRIWYTPSQAGCPIGGTCTVAAPASLTSGLVSWMVLTWNPYGYGPWSTAMSAVVDVADAAVPTPVPGSPSGPIATRTPTYSWSSIGNAIWYQLSVTDGLGIVREFWYSPAEACALGPCTVTPNVLLGIGPAQWKVRAWRTSGGGAWTAPVGFEAVDSAPGTATLVSPLTPVTTVTPSFTWNAALGTSYYLLRVTDRDDLTVDRWYVPSAVGCPLGTGTCTASPGISLKAGAANWKVLTWNGSGYGPWSDTREFLVDIADPAALTPDAVSPTGAISTTNVTYRWTAVAGVVSYRIAIRNNGGASTYWWYSPVEVGCETGAECSAVPPIALLNGTAEWQVQAWTTLGHGAWSLPVALTVSITAPLAPTLVSPTGLAGSASPVFRWNASANATLYYVRVNDPTGLRIDRWLTPSQVGCTSGGVCVLNAGVTLTSGAGFWHVIAWNPTAYSPWSSGMAFVVP